MKKMLESEINSKHNKESANLKNKYGKDKRTFNNAASAEVA